MRDLLESLDQLTVEAAGQFAEPFYELQDDYCGGECPSSAHKALIDEMVMFMSGDDIKEFVAKFRREHDMNHPGEDGDYGEDDPNFS